jgi:hypothetical protein
MPSPICLLSLHLWLSLAVATAFGAFAQFAVAAEPVVLRWKWLADEEWVADFTQQVVTDSAFGAKNLRLAITNRSTQRWRVASVTDDGVATLTQSYVRIAVDVDMGTGSLVTFDSQQPGTPTGEAKRLADVLQPLVGPEWKLVVSQRGELVRLEPSAEWSAASEPARKNTVLQPLFAADGVVGPLRQAFVALPAAGLTPGGEWHSTAPFKSSFGVGEITTDYTYEGAEARGELSVAAIKNASRIAVKASTGKVAKARELTEQKIGGRFLFDAAAGALVESRQTQTLRTESRVRDIPLAVQLASEWSLILRKQSPPANP